MKNLKSIDLGYFIAKSHLDENGSQKYLVFKPILRCFTPINTGSWITGWKSKGLCNQIIVTVSKTDNTITPAINWFDGDKMKLRFAGSYLRQNNSYTTMEK